MGCPFHYVSDRQHHAERRGFLTRCSGLLTGRKQAAQHLGVSRGHPHQISSLILYTTLHDLYTTPMPELLWPGSPSMWHVRNCRSPR
jgi:hypothetical protein